MRNSIKIKEHLPFCQSFVSNLTKNPLKCKTVNNNLGNTFYPRLASIYNNTMEAVIFNNTNYLKTAAIPQLTAELTKRRQAVRSLNVKMKANEPSRKLLTLKNYILPETVYRTDHFYISVVCRAYFGGQYSMDHPFDWFAHEKTFRFGSNRRLLWNTDMSLSQNLTSFLKNYILEFVVRIESNHFINLYDLHNTNIYSPEKLQVRYDEDDFQDVVATELVLRSGSEKFDWILHDINGILRNKSKS